MDDKEARNILSDIRDGHLQFAEGNNIDGKWLEIYPKEAWAYDLGAKALEKQIPKKPVRAEAAFPYNIFTTQKCANCGNPIIGNKIYKYCPECGQKIDWGEE